MKERVGDRIQITLCHNTDMMTHNPKPVFQVEKVSGQKKKIGKVEKPRKPPAHSIRCWVFKAETIFNFVEVCVVVDWKQ